MKRQESEVTVYTRGKEISVPLVTAELEKINGLDVGQVKRSADGYVFQLYYDWNNEPGARTFDIGLQVEIIMMQIIAEVKFNVKLTNNSWVITP